MKCGVRHEKEQDIRDGSCFAEIMDDLKSFRLSVLRIVVITVGDQDLVVGDA